MSESAPHQDSVPTGKAKVDSQRHIANRRLFDTASGQLRLEEWEHNHMRVCKICEGVLCVMVSMITKLPEGGEPPADAA
jgi:hypothetical protein